MRILVISDTHLALPFEPKKFELLQRIVSQADRVIINGDFWEGYHISFDSFLNSSWKKLFPLLKSKKTVYLFGNHDKKILSDSRISLFSNMQTNQFRLSINNNKYIFEHGNRFYPFFDDVLKMTKPPLIISKITSKIITFFIHAFGKKYIQFFYRRFNDVIKKRVEKEFAKNEILVCGHTHFAEVDLKKRFINTGFVKYGLAQYLIINNGKISAKEEWYDKPFF